LFDKLGLSSDSNCHSFRIGVATSDHAPILEDHLIQLDVGGHQTTTLDVFILHQK